jgi:hypothetical protein
MILSLILAHATIKGKDATFEIWNVPAQKVAEIRQCPRTSSFNRDKMLEEYVQKLIVAKLPPGLYNYKVVRWELSDHADRHPRMEKLKQKDGRTIPVYFRGAKHSAPSSKAAADVVAARPHSILGELI